MATDYYKLTTSPSMNLIELLLPDEIDTEEFDRINESILGDIRGNTSGKWIIDLTSVRYLGSAMLGLIINLRQQIKSAGGQLVLCGLSDPLIDIFHTCSLERLFRIAKARADALRELGIK